MLSTLGASPSHVSPVAAERAQCREDGSSATGVAGPLFSWKAAALPSWTLSCDDSLRKGTTVAPEFFHLLLCMAEMNVLGLLWMIT